MSSISALATVPLVLADALISAETSILASLARPLTVTAFLALTAALASWLGREVLFVISELMLEVERR
jgi:hypothetical protein